MKMAEVKQEVYSLTKTKSTKELKKGHPELTKGLDLRYKAHWLRILEQVKSLRQQVPDISLDDLERSEKMLKDSLFKVGAMAGMTEQELELDWQRINLEAQVADIDIEEL